MGQSLSSTLTIEDIDQISKETGFTGGEIRRLFARFCRMDTLHRGYLTREDFLRIPELAVNPLGELIVDRFFDGIPRSDGINFSSEGINFKQFAYILAHFRLPHLRSPHYVNSREGKIRFLFQIFDKDKNGVISIYDIQDILAHLTGKHLNNEEIDLVAQSIMKSADKDNDALISYEEFLDVMSKHNIEVLMSIRFKSN